jgi:hypothetical protein
VKHSAVLQMSTAREAGCRQSARARAMQASVDISTRLRLWCSGGGIATATGTSLPTACRPPPFFPSCRHGCLFERKQRFSLLTSPLTTAATCAMLLRRADRPCPLQHDKASAKGDGRHGSHDQEGQHLIHGRDERVNGIEGS